VKYIFSVLIPVLGKRGIAKYFLLGLASGLSSFLFISCVNYVVTLLMTGRYTSFSKEYLLFLLAIIFIFISTRRILSLFCIEMSQRMVWRLRKYFIQLALQASFQQLTTRKDRIRSAIMSDVGSLSGAAMASIDFVIQLIMSIACLAYLASISWILFSFTMGFVTVGIVLNYYTSKKNIKGMEKARQIENEFLENLSSILNGFKEIFMEPRKGKFINETKIRKNANDSFKFNMISLTGVTNVQILGQVLFYLLVTFILLVFSVQLGIRANDIVSFVFTLFFLLGSIGSIVGLLPAIMQAKVASNNVEELKKQLRDDSTKPIQAGTTDFASQFDKIIVKDFVFRYSEEENAFKVGPVNFTLHRGQTVFIYGGNGSGKTTFMQALIGLCYPTSGEIRVNFLPVTEKNYTDYRKLFSVVFSDFYLFNEIIVENFDEEKWNFYIELFELKGIVSIEDRKYSRTDLSTGQRKRLALIAALMEEKPVLVLDEWAADQDPAFRRKFYTRIIPHLNRNNFTIIAITHDDKYYNCADKLYKMEEGKLIEEVIGIEGYGVFPPEKTIAD
jgi:putative ATP-binding cassette transporter